MSAGHWYYRLDGRPHGPFTVVQFEKLIRGKTVTVTTDVSQDGKTWQQLSEFLAGIPAEESSTILNEDLVNAQTLRPGEVRLPAAEKEEKKSD